MYSVLQDESLPAHEDLISKASQAGRFFQLEDLLFQEAPSASDKKAGQLHNPTNSAYS